MPLLLANRVISIASALRSCAVRDPIFARLSAFPALTVPRPNHWFARQMFRLRLAIAAVYDASSFCGYLAPLPQTIPSGRHLMWSGRRLLIRFAAVVAGTGLFLMPEIGLPAHTWAQSAADTKIVPLDLKPGLWEFKIHTSNTDVSYAASKAAMEQLFKNYTPEQR